MSFETIKVWKNIRFFKYEEFDSPDEKDSGLKMQTSFVKKLDKARSFAKIPFVINSGYRTDSHNKSVGGTKDSSHKKGLAADIHVKDNQARKVILNALIKAGLDRRIGIGETFIHVDDDNDKPDSFWLYT